MIHPRSRAFALIEMIGMIVLLAAFMLVFSALFKATYLGHREAARRDSLDLRVDTALESLRRDIWSAHALATANGELTLTMDDHSTTHWHFGPTWTRTPTAASPTRWTDMPPDPVAIETHGPLLTLRFIGEKNPEGGQKTTPETITFISQLMLAGVQ
jgi:hypothetical protein